MSFIILLRMVPEIVMPIAESLVHAAYLSNSKSYVYCGKKDDNA